jgi:hypothetical protein
MGKLILVKGDHVVAKKWSGEEFLGVYEYQYLDGSHCIFEVKSNRRFNAKPNDVRIPSNEEENEITRIIKEKKAILKSPPTTVNTTVNNEELEMALAAV